MSPGGSMANGHQHSSGESTGRPQITTWLSLLAWTTVMSTDLGWRSTTNPDMVIGSSMGLVITIPQGSSTGHPHQRRPPAAAKPPDLNVASVCSTDHRHPHRLWCLMDIHCLVFFILYTKIKMNLQISQEKFVHKNSGLNCLCKML